MSKLMFLRAVVFVGKKEEEDEEEEMVMMRGRRRRRGAREQFVGDRSYIFFWNNICVGA